jgi:hypothetical protein
VGSPESEIAQPRPRTYLEYMGGMDYSDEDMEGGDEFPPVEMEMETAEVPMPSVQIDSEYLDSLDFLNDSEFVYIDTGVSTHPSMPALTTDTTAGNSNSSMGWNNTTWGQVDTPNWSSPTSSWGVPAAQPQVDRWALSTSPQMEYARGLGWGVTLSVCLILVVLGFNFNFFLSPLL